MQTPNTLNITVGTDVILNVTLEHEGVVLNPALIDNLQANLITGLGRKTPLETSTGIDYIVVNIPWVDGRLPGCYSLEITGSINDLAWSAVGKSIIRYTSATEIGHSTVDVSGDSYDVTMEVGYYFTDSPIEGVDVSVDNGVGTPSAIPSYIHKELGIAFHNLKGNGIKSIEQTTTSEADHGVNVVTITDDLDNATNVEIRNGGTGGIGPQGPQGDSAIWTGEGEPWSGLKNTTGDSTTEPMTQKAVTDELVAESKAIGEWEEVLLSLLPQANCYPNDTIWVMRTSGTGAYEQRHIVVPVTGGDQILLTCVSSRDNTVTGARYAWLTSAYDNTPPQRNASLPLASGETEARTALIADGEMLVKAPTDAAYLCLTIAAWEGSAATMTWKVMKKQQVQDLAKQVRYNTDDLDNTMKWLEHRNDVRLANGYINANMVWNTTSSNYKGKVFPFEDYAGKRVRITKIYDGASFSFAFLKATPTTSAVSFCDGWEGVVFSEYDDYVPSDCKYLYTLAYNATLEDTDVTPHIETREPIADIDELEELEAQFPKTGQIQLAWRVGKISSSGYDYTDTTSRISEEFSVDSNRSFSVHNPHNDLVRFGVYEIKPDGTIHNHDTAGWVRSKGKTYKPQAVGSKMVIRIMANSGSIADVDEANFPTAEYLDKGTVGIFRTYTNITGMLTWERKEISASGIVDNNGRLLAKIPSIGSVEVRVQRPGGYMSIWKKVGNTITCLYQPDYYGFRYVGDYTSEYYVMLQAQENLGTLDYPFTSVCLYSDEGKRFDRVIPDSFINKKMAVFGCSIEQGYNKKLGQDIVLAMQKPWGELVAEETRCENYMNYSIGNALTPDTDPVKYDGRLVGWKSAEVNVIKITGYDIVFVNLGSNDYGKKIAMSTFATAFAYVLETLKANNTRVLVLTPFRRNNHPSSPAATFDAYCEKEIEIAEEMGIEVIPTHTYTNSAEFASCFLPDNLHVNESGHRIIADSILDWMAQQE